MGKHSKPKVKGGRHARPISHPVAKRVAAVSATAAAVPVAGLMFSTTASAATSSQWDQVAQYESGGDWAINHSSDGCSVGGLQFQSSGDGCSPSWEGALSYLNFHGYDTSGWTQHMHQGMPRSQVPTKDQQILAGEAWLDVSGPSAWANGNASGLVSMFRGGPNPWGLSGTNVPAGLVGGSAPAPDPVPVPDPVTPPPVPVPTPTPNPGHHWDNCTDAHKHGWHDFRKASSGYERRLDRDHDGVACESWHKPVTPPPSPVTPPVTPPVVDPTAPVAPASCDHIVVPGDTVSGVAASVGAPLSAVEAVNPNIAKAPRPGDYSLIFSGGHIHMPAGFCASGA